MKFLLPALAVAQLSSRVLGVPVIETADLLPDRSSRETQQQEILTTDDGDNDDDFIYEIRPSNHIPYEQVIAEGRPFSLLSEQEPVRFAAMFSDTEPSEEGEDIVPMMSIPSRYQSTVLARRLLALSSHGDLITVFPSPQNLSSRIPSAVHDTPIGLPEYIASCEEPSGNPTILSLKISTSTINAKAGSNVTLSLSWWDEYIHLTGQRPWALANLPRLSLTGYLEEISHEDVSEHGIETCFLKNHRDSIMWLPGRKWAAHEGFWTRLVVMQTYWIGGFGDKNYIGWLDPEEWRAIKKEEWEAVRLPGEKA